MSIDREICTSCKSCLGVCPHEAIEMKDGKTSVNEYCQSCKICIAACPEGAIKAQ